MTGKCVRIIINEEFPEEHPARISYVFRMLDRTTQIVNELRLKQKPKINETWWFCYRKVSNGFLFMPEIMVDDGGIERREQEQIKRRPKRTEWKECV